MPNTERLFIGVLIQAEAKACGAPWYDDLVRFRPDWPGVRPTSLADLHVTLRFLGDLPAGSSQQICHELTATLRPGDLPTSNDSCSTQAPAGLRVPSKFSTRLVGLNEFRTRGDLILWAGLEPPAPWQQLAAALSRIGLSLGCRLETRPFQPHVTFARIRGLRPTGFDEWCHAMRHQCWAEQLIDSVALFRSEWSDSEESAHRSDGLPAAPRYNVLERWPLPND